MLLSNYNSRPVMGIQDGYISGGGEGLYSGELIIRWIFCCLSVDGYISGGDAYIYSCK